MNQTIDRMENESYNTTLIWQKSSMKLQEILSELVGSQQQVSCAASQQDYFVLA